MVRDTVIRPLRESDFENCLAFAEKRGRIAAIDGIANDLIATFLFGVRPTAG